MYNKVLYNWVYIYMCVCVCVCVCVSVLFSHSVVSNSLQSHGLQPVHHQLQEFTQTHDNWVSDAIQPFVIHCRPLLLPSVFASIRVFSSESVLCIRWPKYCSFSISPSSEYSDWFPLGWTGWISLLSSGLSRVFSNTTVQKHQFFSAQLSLKANSQHPCMTTEKTIALTRRTFVPK